MANVLVLKSSINGETSLTNQLINEFLAARGRRDTAIGSPNTISVPWRCQRWIAPCSLPCAGQWIRSLLSARRSPSPTSLSPS